MAGGVVGEYQLQAAITALQIQAPDADATDWAQIARLYDLLERVQPSLHQIFLQRVGATGVEEGMTGHG